MLALCVFRFSESSHSFITGCACPLTFNRKSPNISDIDASATDICKGYRMSDASPRPHDVLPLTPAVFHILLALADGEKHGYGIMQEVIRITNGDMRMGPGTLYGTIKRMLEAGFLEETDERPDPMLD